MERERWLPDLAGHPNVFVNIALFRLWGDPASRGAEPLRMNVVVGKSLNHQTPIFVEQMEYVIFRPYWNPPRSIVKNEILPHARRDPAYLDKEDMEIVADGSDDAVALAATDENLEAVAAGTLTLRQRPGPEELAGPGQVHLSERRERLHARHAGVAALLACAARLQPRLHPARGSRAVCGMGAARSAGVGPCPIDKAMQGDRPTHVTLKNRLTVVLFYNTAHVNSEGVAYFVDDIYGHDAALDAALRRGYPYPTK